MQQTSSKMLWTGRILSGIAGLMMLAAATPKLMMPAALAEGFQQYGLPASLVMPIGVIELACTLIYLIPRTRVLGAILMTGLLGGATATNVRIGNPSLIMTIILGVLVWAGLFFRDQRLRALLPFRSAEA